MGHDPTDDGSVIAEAERSHGSDGEAAPASFSADRARGCRSRKQAGGRPSEDHPEVQFTPKERKESMR